MAIRNRETLLASLRGQRVEVPNLAPIFASWPVGQNPNGKALVPEVDKYIESLTQDRKKIEKLKAANFALFASNWWPKTKLRELRILAFYTTWTFAWDDETDEPKGVFMNVYDAAQAYRQETVAFVSQCLKLNTEKQLAKPANAIVSSFQVIGDALCVAYSIDQRKIFMEEFCFSIEMNALEQQRRLSGTIPTLEEYWRSRVGASGVGTFLALADFANETRAPNLMQNIKPLWDSTNIIICITNDLLSLKKEMATGYLDSLIPLTVAMHGDPQRAINEALSHLRDVVLRFEDDAKCLLSKPHATREDRQYIQDLVDDCKIACTGNLGWSLSTQRYGIEDDTGEDGGKILQL